MTNEYLSGRPGSGGRVAPDRPKEQQGHYCSDQSRTAKIRKSVVPTRSQRDARGRSSSDRPQPRIGIDTIVLTRQVPAEIPIQPTKEWSLDNYQRRHPISREILEWLILDQLSTVGWRLEWNEDYRLLNVRLGVPRLMSSSGLANYPLQPFHLPQLERASYQMAHALGVRDMRTAKDLLNWQQDWGVRRVDCSADLPVENPTALVQVISALPHPGDRVAYDTGVRWASKKASRGSHGGNGRTAQYYNKGAQLRSTISKAGLADIERLHGPVGGVMRMEVSLPATNLKTLTGLKTTCWLPTLPVVADPKFARWVLFDELHSKLKIKRVVQRASTQADLAAGLAHDIVAACDKYGEVPRCRKALMLVGAYQVYSEAGGSSRSVADEYGWPRSTLNKILRELRDCGFPPGKDITPRSHRLLGSMLMAFGRVCPTRPTKPVIPESEREAMSITAPWVMDHDVTRSVEGISIEDEDDCALDEICAVLLEGDDGTPLGAV